MVARVEEDGELKITGGAVYHPELTRRAFVKCDACYEKDKTLRDYQPCEVYSRIVGYLRPVQQWNPGKKAEFGMRKMFDARSE